MDIAQEMRKELGFDQLNLFTDEEVDIAGMLNNVKRIYKKFIYFKKIFIY